MTLLHAFFQAKNLQAFQRLLDGSPEKKQGGAPSGTPGTSGGHRPSPLNTMANTVDVNARDWLGRTILHLAVISDQSLDYVRALLKHPNINVNVPDAESQWTPLHRALYHANIPAARLLLQRTDTDASLKDKEGYTAFDVYNSTVHGTKPQPGDNDAELFTWGANRNAALGHGDGNDRAYPDRVSITPREECEPTVPLLQRFSPIYIRDAKMSKLHTAVITSESAGNLRVCGFGSGGRLGRGQQMQYHLNLLPDFDYTIVAVALGQDHTLAVTKNGEVLSWGLNRFSQLGYTVETTSGKFDEPIQATPKKIIQPLRKEFVVGVAACKSASACWTEEDVYTWGTNHGQLGYDKQAHPVQVVPRKVTKFSQPIIAMSMTDTVIAGLLRTQQVECIWNDRHYRINFPMNAFPSEIQPYRPPQAIKASQIAKITASEDIIAALSSNGEVFTFAPPPIPLDQNNDGNPAVRHPFQPQRIWALRKKFSSVRDVAIGTDGSIIICTESGHVYTRIRGMKGGGKNFKFQRVPYLQRITHVTANSTGAFGARRIDFRPKAIQLEGNTLAQDLASMEPFQAEKQFSGKPANPIRTRAEGDDEEESEDPTLEQDALKLRSLFVAWKRERERVKAHRPVDIPSGADTVIQIGSLSFPAHRFVLAARSPPLLQLLAGTSLNDSTNPSFSMKLLPLQACSALGVSTLTTVKVAGITPLTLLILLHYLYSDEVLAIWDRRLNVALANDRTGLNVDVSMIKTELQMLARVLDLPAMVAVLPAPVKRLPAPTFPRHMDALFTRIQDSRTSVPEALRPDILLQFSDKDVWAHSIISRCRSPFFAALFGSEEWTARRWNSEGVLKVDFKHLKWHVMQFVLRFMLCGEDQEMFEVLPFVKSSEELIEFMFEVMGAAAELLLDRLMLICSSVILTYLDLHNCCYILAEATYYHAVQLIDRVHEYMAANMETLLEFGILDDLPLHLLQELSTFISAKQTEKATFTRSPVYVDSLLAKYWDWLADQDIPVPIVRTAKSIAKETARLKAAALPSRETPARPVVLPTVPSQSPHLRPKPSGDDLFAMDDLASPPAKHRASVASASTGDVAGPVWKVADAPRVDMKALMAEAQLASPAPLGASPKHIAERPSVERPRGSAIPDLVTPTKNSTPRNLNSPWRVGSQGRTDSSPAPSLSSAFPIIGAAASSSKVPVAGPSSRSPAPVLPSMSAGLSMTKPGSSVSPMPSSRQQGGSRPSGSGLGPVITPTKQPSKAAANSIRVASGKAWTLPPPEPVQTLKVAKGSTSATMSFAAIQQAEAQSTLAAEAGLRDRRSLKEIQQEEAESQQEAEFMKWWAEEEERTRQELAALELFQSGSQSQSQGQTGGGRKGGRGGDGSKSVRQSSTDSPAVPGQSGAGPRSSKSKGKGRSAGKSEGVAPVVPGSGPGAASSQDAPRRGQERQKKREGEGPTGGVGESGKQGRSRRPPRKSGDAKAESVRPSQ